MGKIHGTSMWARAWGVFSPFKCMRLGAACVLGVAVMEADAGVFSWDTAVNHADFHTAGNWTPAGVPGVGDEVLIGDTINAIERAVDVNAGVEVLSVSLTDFMALQVDGALFKTTGAFGVAGGSRVNLLNDAMLEVGGQLVVDGSIHATDDLEAAGTVVLDASSLLMNGLLRSEVQEMSVNGDVTFAPTSVVEIDNPDQGALYINGNADIQGGTFYVGNITHENAQQSMIFNGPTTVGGGTFYTTSDSAEDGFVRFAGLTTYLGDMTVNGVMRQIGNVLVSEDSTINADVLLPNSESERTWTLDRDLTLNINRFQADDSSAGDLLVNVVINDSAALEVNLRQYQGQSFSSWKMGGDLVIHSDGTLSDSLKGAAVTLLGAVEVSGATRWTSRVVFDNADKNTTLAQGASLTLSGGSQNAPNYIDGAQINGGTLKASSSRALDGNGTIGSDIQFLSNSKLRASHGVLNLEGAILDVGTIGTANVFGTLNVTEPWYTNVSNQVELLGGVLTGAMIINNGDGNGLGAGGINGFGLINAPLRNETHLTAIGGTLRIDGAGNNWDGFGGQGMLQAMDGNLHLTDIENSNFSGIVKTSSTHELFIDDFRLNFNIPSSVQMFGGTLRSNQRQSFAGAVIVLFDAATIDADADYRSTVAVGLNNDLTLRGDSTVVEDASFTGTGTLRIPGGSTLRLMNDSQLDVDVFSLGSFVLGEDTAHAQVNADVHSAGVLEIDLAGSHPFFYDVLTAQTIELSGVVDVSLLSYTPSLGDEFDVLNFDSFVDAGYSLSLPGLDPGLVWDISDFETLGVLRIELIPEPTALGMLSLLAMAAAMRRKR